VDDLLFEEPPGGEFVDPLHVTLPARVTGHVVDTDHPDFFTFDLNAPGPILMRFCSRYDFQGWLFIYDKFGGWWDYQYVGQGGCSEVVHDLDEARRWRIGLLDPGGYELTLNPVEAWPQPSWGLVLDPFFDEQKLHLEAELKNTGIISGQPDQVRFWTSGYGFIGTSPLNSDMVFEWVPNPPLHFGTYGIRAQLVQGDTPITDVTPLTLLYFKFVDVPPGSWAEEAIYKIYQAGITKGCSQNPLKYCPYDPVTRAQMAAFIVRAVEGEPPSDYCVTGSPFSDVSSNTWPCKYIKRLSELEITQGCGPGIYCPNNNVTRAEMAAFLIRAVEGEPPADYCDTGSPFTDVSPDTWPCKYIKRLFELGITTGYADGTYRPKNIVFRDQMAVFLARMLDQLGLVAYFPFNGNANDESGNGNHGTVHGATLTKDRFGNPGRAYSFDGVDDYIVVQDDDSLEIPDDFSISVWVKPKITTNLRMILNKHRAWTNDDGTWWFSIESVRNVIFQCTPFNGTPSDTANSMSMPVADEWSHLAITYDASNDIWKIYINGTLDATGTAPFDITNNSRDLFIGVEEYTPYQNYFYGIIDDIRLYNRALSKAEIKAFYNLVN
jgi:hypothetical protein